MKPFTLTDLRASNWEIPNLHQDYSLENTQNKKGYLSLKHIPSDTLLIVFNKTCDYNDIIINNIIKIVDLKLINEDILSRRDSSVVCLKQMLDTLYYLSNPYKATTLKGKVFSKTFKALDRRFERNLKTSPVTLNLLKLVINQFKKDATREGISNHDITNKEFREAMYNKFLNFNYLSMCYLSGKIDSIGNFTIMTLREGRKKIHQLVAPDEFNYHMATENTRVWLKEDEVYYEGVIFNVNDVELVTCPCCNRKVPQGIMIEDENACKTCVDQRYKIHNYTTRVPTLLKFRAKKVTPKTIYFGCELEYETTNREDARIKVGKLLKHHAIMKSDGSIRNGFEIVTCPATIDIHLEEFKNFFDNKPSELKTASNVGMHVHISRAPLNYFTIGKITEFFNKSSNKLFISQLAGREPNTYCRQDTSRTISYPLTNESYSERYNTVNLCNADTIEIRIFSTPENYTDFASKLQFCQAIVDYCSPAAVGKPLKELTMYQTFIDWVFQRPKDYPQLTMKLKEIA